MELNDIVMELIRKERYINSRKIARKVMKVLDTEVSPRKIARILSNLRKKGIIKYYKKRKARFYIYVTTVTEK